MPGETTPFWQNVVKQGAYESKVDVDHVVTRDGHTVRYRVHLDPYDFQSWAHADRWDTLRLEWVRVTEVLAGVWWESPYHKDETGLPVAISDCLVELEARVMALLPPVPVTICEHRCLKCEMSPCLIGDDLCKACRRVTNDSDYIDLGPTQRSRYDEAKRCGASHNDAMEAALFYGK